MQSNNGYDHIQNLKQNEVVPQTIHVFPILAVGGIVR